MKQDDQIKYWATMLNEAMGDNELDEVDLGNFSGTMTDIIKNQIIEPLNGCRTP